MNGYKVHNNGESMQLNTTSKLTGPKGLNISFLNNNETVK